MNIMTLAKPTLSRFCSVRKVLGTKLSDEWNLQSYSQHQRPISILVLLVIVPFSQRKVTVFSKEVSGKSEQLASDVNKTVCVPNSSKG